MGLLFPAVCLSTQGNSYRSLEGTYLLVLKVIKVGSELMFFRDPVFAVGAGCEQSRFYPFLMAGWDTVQE